LSNIHLILRPGQAPIGWSRFRRTHPYYSIALDGYVRGRSKYDPDGPWLTLDHHEDVDRLSARATCSQMLLCLRQGLLEAFRDSRGPYARVFANDCDEDVCVSWYLLANPTAACLPSHRRLERLVRAADWLDTTAGGLVHPLDETLMREMSWIFAPYRQARLQGALDRFDVGDYRRVIDAVTRRIGEHVAERGGANVLDTRFERLGGSESWALVREIGASARSGMVAAGIRAYVSVRPRADGAWSYTVARVSPFVPFDVQHIFARLNEAEPPGQGRWGGSSLVGGSPRLKGSTLTPREVERIVSEATEAGVRRRKPARAGKALQAADNDAAAALALQS
jgi:hypothetical protein